MGFISQLVWIFGLWLISEFHVHVATERTTPNTEIIETAESDETIESDLPIESIIDIFHGLFLVVSKSDLIFDNKSI